MNLNDLFKGRLPSFTKVVASSGGNYTTLAAACNAQSDAANYGTNSIYIRGNINTNAGATTKAYSSIIGAGKSTTTLYMDLGDGASAGDVELYSTVDIYKTGYIQGLTIKGKNCRYAAHPQHIANSTKQTFVDCDFIHETNVASGWNYQTAAGTGLYDACSIVFKRCSFTSAYRGLSSHNIVGSASTGSTLYASFCDVVLSGSSKEPYVVENICGTGNTSSTFTLDNCTANQGFLALLMSGSHVIANQAAAKADAVEIRPTITGSFNNVSYRGNATTGSHFKQTALALKFGYNGTAATLNINAGTTGTDAKPLIWGTATSYNLGYGNNSFVHGSLDVSGQYTPVDSSSTLLGARLGNCTGTNKSFKIDASNIVLNKNYTSMTNAQVIADIQAAVDTVFGAGNVVVYEYSVMDNWRPAIENYTEDYTCGAAESVVPSQLVTMPDGRLAVGWAYIAAGATGKVLTKGKVTQYTANSAARTALTTAGANTNITVEVL